LLRDHFKNQEVAAEVFRLTVLNLALLQPLHSKFMDEVTQQSYEALIAEGEDDGASILYDKVSVCQNPQLTQSYKIYFESDVDFEEFQNELKSLANQLINLLTTLLL